MKWITHVTHVVELSPSLPAFIPQSAGAGQIGGIVRPEDDVATDRVVVAAFLWAAVLVSLAELVAAFALVGSLRPFRRPVCNAHGRECSPVLYVEGDSSCW